MKKISLIIAASTLGVLLLGGGVIFAHNGNPFIGKAKQQQLTEQTVALQTTAPVTSQAPDPLANDLAELRQQTMSSRRAEWIKPTEERSTIPASPQAAVQVAATPPAKNKTTAAPQVSRGNNLKEVEPQKPAVPTADNTQTPAPQPSNNGLTAIMGSSRASKAQLEAYIKSRNPNYPLPGFSAQIYFDMERIYGIRADIAFLQMVKETNALKFGGDVQPGQHNPAGLGATGGGNPGLSFATWADGIEAQFQHLYAYASTDPLPPGRPILDPRFKYVSRGCAPNVEWLGIPDNPNKKGWAADQGYGYAIINMLNQALSY